MANKGGNTPSVNKSKVGEFSKDARSSPEAIDDAGEMPSLSDGTNVLEDTASTSKRDKITLTISSVCPVPSSPKGSRVYERESFHGTPLVSVSAKIKFYGRRNRGPKSSKD